MLLRFDLTLLGFELLTLQLLGERDRSDLRTVGVSHLAAQPALLATHDVPVRVGALARPLDILLDGHLQRDPLADAALVCPAEDMRAGQGSEDEDDRRDHTLRERRNRRDRERACADEGPLRGRLLWHLILEAAEEEFDGERIPKQLDHLGWLQRLGVIGRLDQIDHRVLAACGDDETLTEGAKAERALGKLLQRSRRVAPELRTSLGTSLGVELTHRRN